jgi:uncharacterized protein YbbC (DUF1343 family)
MHALSPEWLKGCILRPCWFEPTFHKHVGKLCAGVQIHVEDGSYDPAAFRPWRLMALAFKALRACVPTIPCGATSPTSTSRGRLAIDVINGGEGLRQWVDDRRRPAGDLDAEARKDEQAWRDEREGVLIYR